MMDLINIGHGEYAFADKPEFLIIEPRTAIDWVALAHLHQRLA